MKTRSIPLLPRRQFLTWAGLGSLAAALMPGRLFAVRAETPVALTPSAAPNDIYARLKVRPVINAMGSVTFLGGSIMAPETLAAMEGASQEFVVITELLEQSGAHLARLLGVEGALVTTGASGAITLGTAACLAGGELAATHQLPEVTGLRHEVILQKTHHNEYETQIRVTGAKIVEVETAADLEAAINARTAMMFFMNKAGPRGKIRRDEWIAIARTHGIPTFLDAAADIPPSTHLASYVREGFDLVAFSGGKALRGPQCTGLLLGRKDLIDAARHNASPYDHTVGRSMKVGKEEIIGLVAAVERFLATDHDAEFRAFETRVRRLADAFAGLNHVRTEMWIPEIANHFPHLAVTWDAAASPRTAAEIKQQLMDGSPRIAVLPLGERSIGVSVLMLRPEEDAIVAKHLRAALT